MNEANYPCPHCQNRVKITLSEKGQLELEKGEKLK